LNLKAILLSQNAKSNLKLNNQELCLYGQERTWAITLALCADRAIFSDEDG